MSKRKRIQFLQSIITIPLFATSFQMTALPSVGIANLIEVSAITTQEMDINQERVEKIDQYFESKNLPLAGYGQKFVKEAIKNEIDWRLLPAIAMRESTGGKFICKSEKGKNNSFGWGSCKIAFESIDESIEIVAKNLGGNNPNTTHYYKDKSAEQILKTYNPDHIVNGYSKQVMRIMETIGSME
ncbi:MAG: hypothetical protein U9R00_02375 [Patescibacteria group bacterium]|nr:hypothetical protein [Patescibacteria group bacterium]